MTSPEMSPFVFEGPAPPSDVIGRDEIIAALWSRATGGRFVLLLAPRRYGKTSVVHRLRRDAQETKELAVVLVDLLGVQTVGDVVARFRSAWSDLPRGSLQRAAEKVLRYLPEITAGAGPVSVTARAPGEADHATRSLEEWLRIPDRVAERLGRRVLVVLDEFQAVSAVPPVDAVIRSVIQHQRERVSYLFAGSEQSLLEGLFSRRAAPLYGQAERITLPVLAAEPLGEFIDTKFTATGRSVSAPAMSGLLGVVSGHPQRAMLLAHHLWEATPEGTAADHDTLATAQAAALAYSEPEFTATMALLSDAQRKVLRLAAWGLPLYGAAAGRLRLTKGGAQSATATLRRNGLLAAAPTRTLIDPLLAAWIRQRHPQP